MSRSRQGDPGSMPTTSMPRSRRWAISECPRPSWFAPSRTSTGLQHRTVRVRIASITSGTPATVDIAPPVRTMASSDRTPSARNAGTIVRDPTSVPWPPASTSTAVVPQRRIVQCPPPSDSVVHSIESDGRGGSLPIPATRTAEATTMIPAAIRRADLRRAHHAAAEIATKDPAAMGGNPTTGTTAGMAPDACRAVSASTPALAAAIEPNTPAAVGHAPPSTIEPTPAIVVTAATGIVTTLSGAASTEIDPPCATAIGVLTIHATSDATVAATIQPTAMVAASCAAVNGRRIIAITVRARSSHRLAAAGTTTSSATTTP